MNLDRLQEILDSLRARTITVEDALVALRGFPYENLGNATIDHHRPLRTGMPEVVFGERKSLDQLIPIVKHLASKEENVFVTRLKEDQAKILQEEFPRGTYRQRSRTFILLQKEILRHGGRVGVISAGASDLPVAEEAEVTANLFGSEVNMFIDVGVAGLHRLLDRLEEIRKFDVLIVVAGMEGALPSVVGGLVGVPIIAVPTSVGYGASFEGLAALLGMLNSCAAGVTVVNIDNGFGAGYVANLIARGRP